MMGITMMGMGVEGIESPVGRVEDSNCCQLNETNFRLGLDTTVLTELHCEHAYFTRLA